MTPVPVEQDGGFRSANENWLGYTATMSEKDEGFAGSVGYPNLFRTQVTTTSGAANRVNAVAGVINGSDSYTSALFIGGTARVYRAVNGAMQLIRSSTITDAKIGRWNWLKPNGDRIVDALSYTHELPNVARPGVPYWYRVAAVGADGLAGTWSAPVTFTPANMTGTASGTVNPTKAINKTGEGGALAAPGSVSVAAGAIAREAVITWAAVSGAEGYVVEQSYYDPATQITSTGYLDLASDPAPILTGDMVILERELLTQDDTLYCNRIYTAAKPITFRLMWGQTEALKRDGNDWSFVPYSGDKPSIAVGDHFLRRTAAAGQTAALQWYWHSGSDQTFYNVLKVGVTYRLRVSMRASAATTVTLTLSGGASVGISGTTFNVGTTFATFTHDMTPTTVPTGATPYDWRLLITAGGTPLNLDVAFFEIEEVGISTNVLASTPPATGGYLRDHSFIKPGGNNRSIKQLVTNDAYGFKAFYDTCVATGNKPWFQIEWNTPQQDWLDLVAYLAAPNGAHAMADLRLASGIPQPWTTTFSNLKLEMGNEAWNGTSGFWVVPSSMTDSVTAAVYNRGNVAGLIWQMISNWMKASPYWSTLSPKLIQHAGGWAVQAFGEDAYRYYPDAKEISIAAYNGGWDNGTTNITETGIGFDGVLSDSILVQRGRAQTRISALKTLCTSLGRSYGTDVRYGIYEAGPGYQLNGLNGVTVTADQAIVQEAIMKSRAAATSTVDAMLTYAEEDFKDFNFFTVDKGGYWTSHSPDFDGGQEYMTHALPRIIHDNIAPARVFKMDTTAIGTKVGRKPDGSTGTLNQIGAWQLRNIATPSKRMIVLVNRNFDPSQLETSDPLYSATPSGTVAFNITTNWNSATSLKAWTAGIGPYRQHNRYPVGQRRLAAGGLTSDPLCVSFSYGSTTLSVPSNIKDFPINASVGAASGGLPAGNVLILLFEGVT